MYFQYGPSSINEVKFAENNKPELYSTQLHPLSIPKHLKSLTKVLFKREVVLEGKFSPVVACQGCSKSKL